MARGTANNEPVVSQANSDAFNEGYERLYGDKPPQRGRWVWDEELGNLVDARDYRPHEKAIHANIMVDRFYEGAFIHDGEKIRDIGSRRKHREFMREKGLTTVDDFKDTWARNEKARYERRTQLRTPSKTRREAIAKALYQKWKP